ncbi:leucyl/phenylalanyl-tRNA--protein transferase [Flavobacteriales bacterium]|nr:leucyl/phenylalanyl-tRNA--protein transferase [Flavobacteriales bacterium]MDA9863439.1 leucyl/phenylalanyl-tRNA--protein transferase [Flavobacteriales bacterium]
MHQLGSECWFPPADKFREDGLVAIGGDLSPDRLLLAYERGIFPWSAPEDPLLWWSPDPRAVLRPRDIKVSKSMRNVLRKGTFTVTFDKDFEGVIQGCAQRPDEGTWITDDFIQAYISLHKLGFAHSAEAWDSSGNLVGGLYGVSLGSMFFGESMFARSSNASKAAFISLSSHLSAHDFEWIDCQIMNPHLASLGAHHIPRVSFLEALSAAMKKPTKRGQWTFNAPS